MEFDKAVPSTKGGAVQGGVLERSKKAVPERLAAHMWGGKVELLAAFQEGQCSRTLGDDNLWYYSWRELKVGTNQGRRNEAAIVGQKDLTEKQAEFGDQVLASLQWDAKATKKNRRHW